MATITLDVRLVTVECCACGMVWMHSAIFDRRMRETHQPFFCPAGHRQSYAGPGEAEQARAEAEKYKKLWHDEQRYAAAVVVERNAVKRSLSATRAQLTKTKKRVANGVCPCCNRHFTNVERHMRGQHPDYSEEA